MSVGTDTPTLPGTKVDAHSATTPANQTVTAAEINAMVTRIEDVRNWLLGLPSSDAGAANFLALAQNGSPPASAANMVKLFSDGLSLLARVNGKDAQRVMPEYVNVKDPRFGAPLDTQVGQGAVINSGSADLSFLGSPAIFSSADVGKIVAIEGAGVGGSRLFATILALVSSSHVTLSANASVSVSNAFIAWGHDDAPAIRAAIVEAQSLTTSMGAGSMGSITSQTAPVVYLPRGRYMMGSSMDLPAILVGDHAIVMLPDPTQEGFIWRGSSGQVAGVTFRGGKYPISIHTNDISDGVLNIGPSCEFSGQDSLGAAIGIDNNSASSQINVFGNHFNMGGTADSPGAQVIHAMSSQVTFYGNWIGAPVGNDVFMLDGVPFVSVNNVGGPDDAFGAWVRANAIHVDYSARGSTPFTGTITGGTSGATGVVIYDLRSAGAGAGPGRLVLKTVSGTFSPGETITGSTGSATVTLQQGGSTDQCLVDLAHITRFGGEGGGKTAVAWHGLGGSLTTRDMAAFAEATHIFEFYNLPFLADLHLIQAGSPEGIWFDSSLPAASRQAFANGVSFKTDDDYGTPQPGNSLPLQYSAASLTSDMQAMVQAIVSRAGASNPCLPASAVQYGTEYSGDPENDYLGLDNSATSTSRSLQWHTALQGWKLPRGLYTLISSVQPQTLPARYVALAADTQQNRTLPPGAQVICTPFWWDGVGGFNNVKTIGCTILSSDISDVIVGGASGLTFRVVAGLVDNRTPWLECYGTGVPTNGRWFVGDIVRNPTPTSGGVDYWRCTTKGRFAAVWQATHAYTVGDYVQNDTGPVKVYRCTTAGTSAGSGGPTGTGSGIVDGTVVWTEVEQNPVFVAHNL